MNKRFIIQIILLLFVISGLWNCYDDKGNYDYKDLISLQIDTVGIKAEQTAYQFENFNVPVNIKYAGDEKNLSYEWKIYPQDPTKDEDVPKYDSAVVLYTKAVFDTIIYEVPGAYYLTLTVTDKSQDLKEYFTMKLNVETLVSRGLCVMDEKNGLYDLNMIKSAKLLTDITKSEEQIYYNVYSSVNNTEITNGKFLGRGTSSANNVLYFFTETGGLKLDVNTYEIISNDYSSWFSLPMSITGAPGAYMITGRPLEVIIDDGLVYAWDHMSMGTTSFGDRLEGDYEAAPYLPRISTSNFATVIFDMKNKRFAPIGQFGSNVGSFESTSGEFDLNNIGATKELKFMENGFNSYTYAVFYDTETSAYSLYVADFSGSEEATPVKKYSMAGCDGLTENSLYTFGNQGNVCFYASGSDLYQYKYASTNKGTVVHSFNGETITGIEVFKSSGHPEDGKLLIVATETGGEGKIYFIDFDELTGAITGGTTDPYTGFGRIVDILYKE